MNKLKIYLVIGLVLSVLLVTPVFAGTLVCSVRSSACNQGEVSVLGMVVLTDSHAELPSESNYTNHICCSGVTDLGNSCSGSYATVLKLAATTDSHVEQNDQTNYTYNACLSVPSGASVSVGYQSTDCSGYDTTLGSISAITDAHIGDVSAYTTKICATAADAPPPPPPEGSLSVDIVDADGDLVSGPAAAMNGTTYSFSFQTVTGTFGTAAQKIRVSNTTSAPQWTLTIAATDSAAALWSSGTATYDYNDPTSEAGDGSDADSVGGQMTIDASNISLGGTCSSTGTTKGTATAFSQGINDTITLLTADGSADTGCYWDLTGVSVGQTLPKEQAIGNYSINMTLTIIAS